MGWLWISDPVHTNCQGAPDGVCSVVNCVTLLRADASAGSGNRVDLCAPRVLCLRVTFATVPSCTNRGKPQAYGIQLIIFRKLLSKIHPIARLRQSFFHKGTQWRAGVPGESLPGSRWPRRHPRGIWWPNLHRLFLQFPVWPGPDAGKPSCLCATVTPSSGPRNWDSAGMSAGLWHQHHTCASPSWREL